MLLRAGLVIERQPDAERGTAAGFYDRFRDRVMFPIRDTRGRTIGFGGRVLDSGEPKYLNSPETELFHKGRELYGLFEARQATRSLQRLLVVEGYMDVVSLHQAGITYAVATLGTATTPDHLQRIFRLVGEVVFCFDGDRAGRAAAWRALENAVGEVKQGRQVRFLFLPEGHDPDTLVREEGAEALRGAARQRPAAVGLPDPRARVARRRAPASTAARSSWSWRGRWCDASRRTSTASCWSAQLAEAIRMPAARLGRTARAATRPPPGPARAEAARSVAARAGSPAAAAGRGNLVRQAISLLVHFPGAGARGRRSTTRSSSVDRPGIPLLVELLAQLREDPAAEHRRVARALARSPGTRPAVEAGHRRVPGSGRDGRGGRDPLGPGAPGQPSTRWPACRSSRTRRARSR